MRRLFAATLLLACLLVPAVRADEVADDQKKMDGTWDVVEVWAEGKQVPEEQVKARAMSIEMKGDTWIRRRGDQERKMKVKLLPKDSPKGIDLTMDGPDGQERTAKGIYEIQKDGTIRFCIADRGGDGERPKKFESENGLIVMTLKKAEKK